MTNDEAIKTLREDYCGNRIICELYPDQCNREDCEIWLAIKALETQPDGDTISRQSAIDALRVAYWDDKIQSAKDDPCIVDAMTDWAIRQVKALPSAQPEPIKITIDHAPIPDELERLKQAMRNTPVMLFPSTQPEITPDGTLNVSIDADVASVGRILLSQTGTQYGGLYYKDALPELSHTQKSCEYCHEDSDGYVRPIDKNSHAWLVRRGRTMKLRVCFNRGYSECDILFCPMCGRRLTDG